MQSMFSSLSPSSPPPLPFIPRCWPLVRWLCRKGVATPHPHPSLFSVWWTIGDAINTHTHTPHTTRCHYPCSSDGVCGMFSCFHVLSPPRSHTLPSARFCFHFSRGVNVRRVHSADIVHRRLLSGLEFAAVCASRLCALSLSSSGAHRCTPMHSWVHRGSSGRSCSYVEHCPNSVWLRSPCSFVLFVSLLFLLLLSANIDSMPADDLWQVVLFSTHFLLSELIRCFLIFFFFQHALRSGTAKGFGERLMSVKCEQICTETGRGPRLVLWIRDLHL